MKRPALVADWAAGAALLAAVSLATVLTTGCSSGHEKSSAAVSQAPGTAQVAETPEGDAQTGSANPVTASPTGPAMVSVASSKVGKILVGETGRSLYLFQADKSSKSTCTGACAAAWPPLVTQGTPKAGPGTSGLKLGTTHRTDGSTQVTVNGRPVYYYAVDKKKGDVMGQLLNQFGGVWWVMDPAGKKITTSPSGTASPSPTGSPSPSGTKTGASGGGY